MTQPVDIELNLNGDYVQGVQQATTATEGLEQAISTVQAPARGLQRALDMATPSRAHLAAWGGFTAAAAYWQQQTSGIRATASAAGQSIRVLDGDVNRLARTFPIGTAGAVAMVQAVQGLGASEKQVGPLASVMERISGATSTFGPQMATSFGQLNREMASLDPSRVQRFGDVLTTVSAKSGASAQGIVDFAQAIAPVAQQAGIGETAVLGISSAFVKLGDDGGAAATAVNKILGDLNRSVREGSNDMVAYAQVTGMTVNQFKALYQANPSRALAAVTSSIGRAGPQGQMMLESLGLEGVRTQRALLQLSQSGGLGQAINQATGAYGNNSTDRAAKQAFGGLNDSLTELRSTAGQTAEALGGPFLGALTKVTDIAKAFVAPLNTVLGSGVVQHGLQGVAGLVVAGMAVRRVARPLGTLALGAQALTSGPVRSAAGGYAVSRAEGDLEAALATRSGRFGQDAIMTGALGASYGRGRFMQGFNRYAGQAGSQAGQLMTDLRGRYVAPEETGGIGGLRGLLGRGARAGATASTMAYEAWMHSIADPYQQASTPAGERQSLLTPRAGGLFSRAGAARSATIEAETTAGTGRFAAQLKGLQASLGLVEKEGGTTSAALGRLASSTMGAAGAMGRFVGGGLGIAGRAGGGMLASGASGLYSMLGGGIGVSMLAGTAAYGLYKRSQAQDSDITNTMRNTDIYGVANSWRDAVGEASKGAATMADAMTSAADTINASVKNFPSARTVSGSDIVAAGRFDASAHRKNDALNYTLGPTSGVQALVQASELSGMTPQDMQGLKISMIRQGMSRTQINSVLGGIQTSGTGGALTTNTMAGLNRAYSSAVSSYNRAGHGLTDVDEYAGKDAQKVAQTIAGGLGQQQQNLTQQFGGRYATQQTARSLVALIRGTKSNQERYTLSHALAASLGYKGKVGGVTTGENATDIFTLPGVSIGGMSGRSLADLVSGPNVARHLQPSIMEAPLRSVQANALLPFFQSGQAGAQFRGGQRAAEYMAAGHEADISAQTKAVNAMVEAATKAGTSLGDLSSQATKATSVTADWQQGLLAAIAAEAQFEQNVRLQGAGRGTQLAYAVSSDIRAINAGPGTDPQGDQAKAYAGARSDLATQRQSVIEFYQQRVMQQKQYQVASQRAQDSYQLQMGRSQDAFYRNRARAVRDFGITMSREVADAAKSLYDPYTRIQVQPVFSAQLLTANSTDQIRAMRQQIANVHKLQSMGMTNATIQMLGLYSPDKAQQTQELVMDLANNQKEMDQLNQQTATRTRLAGQLVGMDPQFQRQRQDFRRGLRDSKKDFDIAQGQMTQDFHISQRNMAQDIHIQDLQITNNMTKLSNDMADIIHGRFIKLHGQVVNILEQTGRVVNRLWSPINQSLLHPGSQATSSAGAGTAVSSGISATGGQAGGGFGNSAVGSTVGAVHTPGMHTTAGETVSAAKYVKANTGSVYHGTTYDNEVPSDDFIKKHPPDPNFNMSIAKRMMPQWASGPQWKAWHDLWMAESGWNQYKHNDTDPNNMGQGAYGIPQSYPGHKMSASGKDWMTNPATQIAWGIGHIKGYGSPLDVARKMHLYNADGSYPSAQYKGYEDGGIATAPHLGMVAEAGRPEAMIPLNTRGIGFLASAIKQYIGAADAKLLSTGGLSTATNVHISHDSYKIDQGQHINGPVTVKANSTAEWAAQARTETRRRNLTATRSVRWSKP